LGKTEVQGLFVPVPIGSFGFSVPHELFGIKSKKAVAMPF
jgi:hypothetical protein